MPTVMTACQPDISTASQKRTKVLHVLGALNRGGVETWLLSLARTINRERFQLDFMVHSDAPGVYDAAIRDAGSRIVRCINPSRPRQYSRRFYQVLEELGPYDAVHSHVHHFSGYILRLAYHAGIRGRIVHSHSDTSMVDSAVSVPRAIYLALMRQQIRKYATAGIAASRKAAAALYGRRWAEDGRWRILYCGVDLSPFRCPIDDTVRREFGIPTDAWVMGHVGSFTQPKNHSFLIRLGLEVLKREPNSFLVMVGDGPLRQSAERQAGASPLGSRVRFCGNRDDVPRLLRGLIDTFIFPSLWEGLPLGLVEAQAAGLPCIISDVITEEADVVPTNISRLSLDDSMDDWVDAVLKTRSSRFERENARGLVESSPFNSETSTRDLERLYVSL